MAVLALLLLCRLAVALVGGPPEAAAESLVVVQAIGLGAFVSLVVLVPAGLVCAIERAVARDPRLALAVVAGTVAALWGNTMLGIWLVFPEGLDFGP